MVKQENNSLAKTEESNINDTSKEKILHSSKIGRKNERLSESTILSILDRKHNITVINMKVASIKKHVIKIENKASKQLYGERGPLITGIKRATILMM